MNPLAQLTVSHNVALPGGKVPVTVLKGLVTGDGNEQVTVVVAPSGGAGPGASQDVGDRMAAAWRIAASTDLSAMQALLDANLTLKVVLEMLVDARETLELLKEGADRRLAKARGDGLDQAISGLCGDSLKAPSVDLNSGATGHGELSIRSKEFVRAIALRPEATAGRMPSPRMAA